MRIESWNGTARGRPELAYLPRAEARDAHAVWATPPLRWVYRLVAAGAIEEQVMELKARKQNLFDRVMNDDALLSSLTAEDIKGLRSA